MVDFKVFRSEIEKGLDFSDRAKGGRPPYDAILVFKILVLQTLYSLLHLLWCLTQKIGFLEVSIFNVEIS